MGIYQRPYTPEEIYHSVKGETWTNHKYIRKEGNRYIYPEDVKGGRTKDSFNSERNITRNENSQHHFINTMARRANQAVSNFATARRNVNQFNQDATNYSEYRKQRMIDQGNKNRQAAKDAYNNGINTAKDAYSTARRNVNQFNQDASNYAEDRKQRMIDQGNRNRQAAKDAYNSAKSEVSNTYNNTKNEAQSAVQREAQAREAMAQRNKEGYDKLKSNAQNSYNQAKTDAENARNAATKKAQDTANTAKQNVNTFMQDASDYAEDRKQRQIEQGRQNRENVKRIAKQTVSDIDREQRHAINSGLQYLAQMLSSAGNEYENKRK